MIGNGNPLRNKISKRIDRPYRLLISAANWHLQHLVEITVEDRSVPANRQQRATHHMACGDRVETVSQQTHVVIQLSLLEQKTGVALDRNVGNRQQMVELNAKPFSKFVFVVRLELGLIGRQRWTRWVEHQIKPQISSPPVTEIVQQLQSIDAAAKDSLAALPVNVVFQITGQRGDNINAVVGQKLRNPLITGLGQNRQIGPIDDTKPTIAKSRHQPLKTWIHFRGAPGQVDRLQPWTSGSQLNDPFRRFGIHVLARLGWPRFNMTVGASLVAQLAQIDLQVSQGRAHQRPAFTLHSLCKRLNDSGWQPRIDDG